MNKLVILFFVLILSIITSCSKDVAPCPPPSATIIWMDSTTTFVNLIGQSFQDTYYSPSGPVPIGRFHYEQFAYLGNESLDVKYEEKPTKSMNYPIPSTHGPILGYMDKNRNTWQASEGTIQVLVLGPTITCRFTNVTFYCTNIVTPHIIASGHITTK